MCFTHKTKLVPLVLLMALLALPANVVAQHEHEIDGIVINPGFPEMDSVRVVVGGNFHHGMLTAQDIASISVVGENGVATNHANGTVGTFDLSGGNFLNRGTITEGGTVSDGVFNNDGGAVTTLNQNAGTVHNSGTFTDVTLSNGRFDNQSGGLILGSLVMNGGIVDNAGWINDLVYGGGTYNAIGTGNFGNLSLDTGQQFDVNRLASITNTFGVDSINLAGANLVWNLNGSLADNLGFFGWDNIFGVDFTNGEEVARLTINWDGGSAIFNADNFGQMQRFDGGYGIIVTMDGVTITPEPATLAVIGLGLAGLGLARRRQMMKATAA